MAAAQDRLAAGAVLVAVVGALTGARRGGSQLTIFADPTGTGVRRCGRLGCCRRTPCRASPACPDPGAPADRAGVPRHGARGGRSLAPARAILINSRYVALASLVGRVSVGALPAMCSVSLQLSLEAEQARLSLAATTADVRTSTVTTELDAKKAALRNLTTKHGTT